MRVHLPLREFLSLSAVVLDSNGTFSLKPQTSDTSFSFQGPDLDIIFDCANENGSNTITVSIMQKPSNGTSRPPQALQADEPHKSASQSDLDLELLQLPSGLRSHPGEESDIPVTPATQGHFNIHPLQQAIHQPPLLTTESADPCVVSAMSQGTISSGWPHPSLSSSFMGFNTTDLLGQSLMDIDSIYSSNHVPFFPNISIPPHLPLNEEGEGNNPTPGSGPASPRFHDAPPQSPNTAGSNESSVTNVSGSIVGSPPSHVFGVDLDKASDNASTVGEKCDEDTPMNAKRGIKRVLKLPCLHPTCKRRFMSEYTRNVHMSTHQQKRVFYCSMGCKETFSRQHDCLRHEVSKHGKVCDWSCNSCKHFFSSEKTFKKHKCGGKNASSRWRLPDSP